MASRRDRPMRVAINCQLLPNSGAGGIEGFTTGLLHALGQLDDGPEEYVIVGPWQHAEWMKQHLGPNQRIVRGPTINPLSGKLQDWRKKLSLSLNTWPEIPESNGFFERLESDVVHFPYQQLMQCKLPMIFNPHDLQHLHYPKYFTPFEFIERESIYRAGCQLAHTVAVSAEWVKADIVRNYRLDPAKIQVIPGAAPHQIYSEPSLVILNAVSEKYDLREPFALYPAITWEHKNHIRLLDALAWLRDHRNLKVRLVCTGKKSSFWPHIEKQLVSHELRDQVSFLGMLPFEEIEALYRLAQFVVIPTLFEADSQPLFEAWRSGTPVACSSVTALPEQAMDAALMFDPNSTESMADAVAQMTTKSELREDLQQRGARRLQDYSWERTAKAYRAVYRRAAGQPLGEEDRWLLSWDWMREPSRQKGS